ncbi:hypothetical protein AB0L06_26045 [Spirillospora sp. NPDC052269]
MRLHLAAITAALVLTPLAAPAQADTPPAITAAASGPVLTNAHFMTDADRAVPKVTLKSTSGVTRVDMRLRGADEARPYPAYDDVPRSSGTANDGLWNIPAWITLHPGRTFLDLEITEASGERTTLTGVAFVDAEHRGWDVDAFTRMPVNTGPFLGEADVTVSADPQRVSAQLFRAGTNEPVGDPLPMLVERRSDYGDWSVLRYRTTGTFAPPAGDYELLVTAWDAQGDQVSDRSSVVRRRFAQRMVIDKPDRTWYDADHPDLTVTGHVTDTSGAPLSGVAISGGGATTTTDATGAFTLTLDAFQGTVLKATGHGDFLETTATVTLQHQLVQPLLTLRRNSDDTPRVGDTVTLSGSLTHRPGSGPEAPLSDKTVELTASGLTTPQTPPFPPVRVTTGADGTYSVQIRITGAGSWMVTANFSRQGEFDSAAASRSLSADYTTAIVMNGPAPKQTIVGSKITLRGKVVRLHVPSDQAVVKEGGAFLEFSTDRKVWRRKSQARFAGDGTFALTGTVAVDGYWRVAYDGANSSIPVHQPAFERPSLGPAYFVDARYRTAISSFNASPEPVKKGRTLTVKGRFTRQIGTWRPGVGALLTIYFKPSGSSRWKAMGTTRTYRDGWFSKNFKASADGTWAAAYAGSPAYLGVWSAGDYVDVR